MSAPTVYLLLAMLAPIGLLLGIVSMYLWWIRRRQGRLPISDKLLRPAGESLRKRISELEEALGFAALYAVLIPFVSIVWLLVGPPPPLLVKLIAGLIVAGLFIWHAVRLIRCGTELRDCILGFHGERAAAEEINQLMLDGCRVFHDVPMPPYGNIDHVVVAYSGVYSIETKTRRKRKAPQGKQRDHEVIYDGQALHFPHTSDSHGLEQARQQAGRLRVFLTKAVGEPLDVMPILTFPGWLVTTKVRTNLKVLNPKQIRKSISAAPRSLSSQIFDRIVHQLDQRCRDVEL